MGNRAKSIMDIDRIVAIRLGGTPVIRSEMAGFSGRWAIRQLFYDHPDGQIIIGQFDVDRGKFTRGVRDRHRSTFVRDERQEEPVTHVLAHTALGLKPLSPISDDYDPKFGPPERQFLSFDSKAGRDVIGAMGSAITALGTDTDWLANRYTVSYFPVNPILSRS